MIKQLVDEKKNWKQFASLWILQNPGYDEGCIESVPSWVAPYTQV